MRWTGAALLVLAGAGCDQVYNLQRPVDAPDANIYDNGCSTITMLSDTFDVDSLTTRWYATRGVSVADGRLVFSTSQPDSYEVVDSIYHYDIRDRAFTFRASDGGPLPPDASFSVELVSEVPDRSAHIVRRNTGLSFVVSDGSGDHVVTTLDYLPTEHAYQRIAVAGTELAFETSADGRTYTRHGTRALDGFEIVRAAIVARQPPTGPGFVMYVDQIGDDIPATPACPISQLFDDFSAPTLQPQWARTVAYSGNYGIDQQTFLSVTDGVQPGGAASVSLLASRLYDLREGAFSVEMQRVYMPSTGKTITFKVEVPGGDRILFEQVDGRLNGFAYHDGNFMNPVAEMYDATSMRWWRIRNSGGATHWEVSPDGMAWRSLSSTNALAGLDHVDVGVEMRSTTDDEDVVQFDNINRP